MSLFNKERKDADKQVDNVLQFRNSNGYRRAKMKLEVTQKKVAITASIVSIAFIVALINQQLLKSQTSGRGIASVQDSAGISMAWQYDLAKKLSRETRRDLASLGSRPNEMDQLRFGVLEGKYALHFDQGSLALIEFSEKESGERPKYIEDKEAFLKNYKNLFKVAFKDVKRTATDTSNSETKQDTFELLDEYNKVMAKASFVSDQYGRVLSMKMDRVN